MSSIKLHPFLESMRTQISLNPRTILFPEAHDQRILKAACILAQEAICTPVLVGSADTRVALKKTLANLYKDTHKQCDCTLEIKDIAPEDLLESDTYEDICTELSLTRQCLIYVTSDDTTLQELLGAALFELRKHKGLELTQALEYAQNPLYCANLLLKRGLAHGMVAGAATSTTDVLRAALQIIKCAPNSSLVSSFFIMGLQDSCFGEDGLMLFSDCGLEIQPNAERLAHIAIESSRSFEQLTGKEPRVALLSHSSHGSTAANPDQAKVQEALSIAQGIDASLCIDGELQLDAAIIPEIAASKTPQSPLQGRANCLIFPDLDAGNIGYKLVQRLAHAHAWGPITQGLAKPINDLSRGCSVDDIIGVTLITCAQAKEL